MLGVSDLEWLEDVLSIVTVSIGSEMLNLFKFFRGVFIL